MAEYRAVVLSDIHFGHLAAHQDFCAPDIVNNSFYTGSISMADSLIQTLNTFSRIDDIVIAGDLTSYATPYEYHCLALRLEAITSKLSNFNGEIIFTLGNHDSNWDMSSISNGEKYNKFDSAYFLQKSNTIYQDFNIKNNFSIIGPETNTGIIQTDSAQFIILNTGLYSSENQPYKHGKIGQKQLDWLRSLDIADNNKWNIVVMHHPLYKYSYPTYCEDISSVEEGSEIEDCIKSMGIDFLIHGHRHHPLFFTENKRGWKQPVHVLCSGSLSVNSTHRMHGQIHNMFHVIELYDRDVKNNAAQGKLLNYKFIPPKGWVKHTFDDYVQLDGEVYFGAPCSETEIIQIISQLISNVAFNNKDWANLPEYPDIRYELKCLNLIDLNNYIFKECQKKKFEVRGDYPYPVTILREP